MAEHSLVLSALEFDVAWESEGHPQPHPALRVPSPGRTYTERAELVRQAWDSLAERGLARRGRLDPEVADRLALFANYRLAVDTWVWEDRVIAGLAVVGNRYAHLAVVESGEVWLIPARASSLAESAVSVTGELPAGAGRSVSVPEQALTAADQRTDGDAKALITGLERQGVPLRDGQRLAEMSRDIQLRGQFGAERRDNEGRVRRAGRVVGFHDNPTGRFVGLTVPGVDGTGWVTVAPADNHRLIVCVRELLDEL